MVTGGVRIEFVNDAGQVAGYSERFSSGTGTSNGTLAFFYDLLSDQTTELMLSVNTATGFASSRVDYLGEDGVVLGAYTLFDAANNNLGERAYYFTLSTGMLDLGLLVDDSFAGNDWSLLAQPANEFEWSDRRIWSAEQRCPWSNGIYPLTDFRCA